MVNKVSFLSLCVINTMLCLFTTSYAVNNAGEKKVHYIRKSEANVEDVGLLSKMYLLRDFRSKRASSWDRTGDNVDWIIIPPGKTHVLLEQAGAGCIKHFYWTYIEGDEAVRFSIFRGVILRAFWDGAEAPSIEVPFGDFFGVSNGLVRPVKSLAFTTNPGTYRLNEGTQGFNCYLPMPFASRARIELENQSNINVRIWYHIDYDLYDDDSVVPANAARLHALWNRENPTEPIKGSVNLSGQDNYTILDVEGDGQFIGYFLTVVNLVKGWWGEGDDMVFIDGESFPPSLHGTGTEEIFGGGACPATEYAGPYTGFHCVENQGGHTWWGTNGMYRFYITDPLRFHKSIRLSLEHGHNNTAANDYSSVAFWYQRGVNTKLPSLPLLSERVCTKKLLSAPICPISSGVFIDKGEVVMSCPAKEQAEIHYTLDGTEPTSQSLKYTGPIQLTETAFIKARAFKKGHRPSDTVACLWTKVTYREADDPCNTVNGLAYSYYEEGQWRQLPDFTTSKPVKSGTVHNFDISKPKQMDDFGFKFTGFISVPFDGIYTFYLVSTDGSRLYIGDQLVVDHGGLHHATEKMGQVALRSGKHAISVMYFAAKFGEERLEVYYSVRGSGKQLIPADMLYRRQ